jgi:hypothetical protein
VNADRAEVPDELRPACVVFGEVLGAKKSWSSPYPSPKVAAATN